MTKTEQQLAQKRAEAATIRSTLERRATREVAFKDLSAHRAAYEALVRRSLTNPDPSRDDEQIAAAHAEIEALEAKARAVDDVRPMAEGMLAKLDAEIATLQSQKVMADNTLALERLRARCGDLRARAHDLAVALYAEALLEHHGLDRFQEFPGPEFYFGEKLNRPGRGDRGDLRPALLPEVKALREELLAEGEPAESRES